MKNSGAYSSYILNSRFPATARLIKNIYSDYRWKPHLSILSKQRARLTETP
jgi:uncharacterized protein involved in tolerance to divalent cations